MVKETFYIETFLDFNMVHHNSYSLDNVKSQNNRHKKTILTYFQIQKHSKMSFSNIDMFVSLLGYDHLPTNSFTYNHNSYMYTSIWSWAYS